MKRSMKRFLTFLLTFILILPLLSSCTVTAGSTANRVKMEFDGYGTIVIELDRSVAPATCKNFADLVRTGFYDGLTIHRIAVMSTSKNNYIIQGGDPNGDGTGGSNHKIHGEFKNNGYTANTLSHTRGVVSMARSSDYDSASSQFFICVNDCSELDGNYAAFGRVIEGLEVLDKIAAVKVNSNNKPVTPVIIKKASLC